ncbi:MAG: TonB-dependent receptor, partial [Flavobacterium sp.]|nr:TonB-dependent receptor [Flavobacterium sp.]
MKLLSILLLSLFFSLTTLAQNGTLKGTVTDENNNLVAHANVIIAESNQSTITDTSGNYEFSNLTYGKYTLKITSLSYKTEVIIVNIDKPSTTVNFKLKVNEQMLDEVEVFGKRNKQPEKLQALTRLPLKPSEQIQSISIISSKLIEQQGNLTISDATKNVPGVYTFATYGNKRESMSSRGFRGIPILKNGVRVNSDFRGVGILTDASGIDNIQVLKGTAAITQGVATDIGSPGGVINIVTKTPKFQSGGEVSLRGGSWGLFRPTFDVYGPIDDNEKIAFRVNGAYERSDSYRSMISSERLYFNPSLQWKANDKTTITVEMDYLDDSRTPDLGTVNLAGNDINAIYDLPHDKFLGFKSDRVSTKNATYTIRVDRKLNDTFSLRAAYFKSDLALDDTGASLSQLASSFNERKRSISNSTRKDVNDVLQLDLVGQDVQTGFVKHTFQAGMDYSSSSVSTTNSKSVAIDTINVFGSIPNNYPTPNSVLPFGSSEDSKTRALGLLVQDMITWNKWLKTFVGLRYSSVEITKSSTVGTQRNDAWNPLAGLIISPTRNINLFGSYTNSSNPRSATLLSKDGEELGNERWDQFEAGFKTTWINDRLRFNLTLFKINNRDMNLPVYDENWVATGYYQKGGNDERKGIEVELSGRI